MGNSELPIQSELLSVRKPRCADPKMSLAAKLDIGARLLALAIFAGVIAASAAPW